MKIDVDLSSFSHKINELVKFHEVDMMSVVNNAVYFNYFEDARVKYLQDLKIKYNLQEVMEDNSFFIMRRNEIEYIEPAQFDDKLIVFTKIDWIKNTSFSFSHVIINEQTKRPIAIGTGILVYIKLSTKEKQQLPAEFYEAVNDFEKDVLIKKD